MAALLADSIAAEIAETRDGASEKDVSGTLAWGAAGPFGRQYAGVEIRVSVMVIARWS